MMARKRKRDAGSQLAGFLNQTDSQESERSDTQEFKSPDSSESKQTDSQESTDLRPRSNPSAAERKKRSYYFRQAVVDRVDELHFRLSRSVSDDLQKSHVVAAAIDIVFADYKDQGEESAIADLLRERLS